MPKRANYDDKCWNYNDNNNNNNRTRRNRNWFLVIMANIILMSMLSSSSSPSSSSMLVRRLQPTTTIRRAIFVAAASSIAPPSSAATTTTATTATTATSPAFNHHHNRRRHYYSRSGRNDHLGGGGGGCGGVSSWSSRAFFSSSFSSSSSPSSSSSFRSSSTTTTARQMTIDDTPLGSSDEGKLLLDGLDVYTVPSKEDGHPLTVYGIDSSEPSSDDHVLLMLHGRTWSSVPVYHLLGGPKKREKFNNAKSNDGSSGGSNSSSNGQQQQQDDSNNESRSLMEALLHKNIKPYAMDFRGFGGTPQDPTGSVEPNRCVEDVESVLSWLSKRHSSPTPEKISLMGWSQGALVAQLTGQRDRPLFSRLILYGSIYDPMVRYPREPLYVKNNGQNEQNKIQNTFDAAVEDFTIEGTIPPKAATNFAEAALLSDPYKAQWRRLYEFNNWYVRPSRHTSRVVFFFVVYVSVCVRVCVCLIFG